MHFLFISFFFFFNDTATTEIYTLSLHDALPILACVTRVRHPVALARAVMEHTPHVLMAGRGAEALAAELELELMKPDWFVCSDRKSTRLNSSHLVISYAVFCLKKKNNNARLTNSLPLSRFMIMCFYRAHVSHLPASSFLQISLKSA